MTFKSLIFLPAASLIFFSCTREDNNGSLNEFGKRMDKISEEYIKLVLKTGKYDPDFVDAYYGPEEFKPSDINPPDDDSTGLKRLYDDSGKLLDMLDSISHYEADEIHVLR